MAKIFRCKDVGEACGWERRAETEDELFEIVVEHVKAAHGLKHLSEEVKSKIRAAIQDE
jgi:predicted small metal-binding protein